MNEKSKVIKRIKFIFYRLFYDCPERKWFRLFIYRMWLLLGTGFWGVFIWGKLDNIPPPYSELQCDQGVIVEVKASRKRSYTNVIKLEMADGNINTYIDGAFDEDIPLLRNVVGQNVTVCFYITHPFRGDNHYAEVIHNNERLLNNHEYRREGVIERTHELNNCIPILFYGGMLLPLLLIIIFVKKNENIYWKWSKKL